MEDQDRLRTVPGPWRCLICYCELTDLGNISEPQCPEPEVSPKDFDSNCSYTTVSGEPPVLSKQLFAFFVLRNVLELSPNQLEAMLQMEGSLETWARLCEQCQKRIKNVKEIYDALQVISKKYEEAKGAIQQMIRISQSPSAHSDLGNYYETGEIENPIDHCRDIICKRQGSNASTLHSSGVNVNPFILGDQKAHQLSLDNRNIKTVIDSFGEVPFGNVDIEDEIKMEITGAELESQPNDWMISGSDPLCDDPATINTQNVSHTDVATASFLESYGIPVPIPPSPTDHILNLGKGEGDHSTPTTSKSKPSVPCTKCNKHKSSTSAEETSLPALLVKNYVCSICSFFQTSDLNELSRHKARDHGIYAESYKCSTCGKINRSSSEKDTLCCCSSSTAEDRPYKCEICGKGFKEKRFKASHIRNVHQKAFEVHCELCKRSLRDRCQLVRHMALVHKIGKFKCEEEGCDGIFGHKSGLEIHLRIKHNKETKARDHGIDADRYKCLICGKIDCSCSEKDKLCCSNSEDKPYVCEICGKRFKNKRFKTKHINYAHQKVSQVHCEICGRQSGDKYQLDIHMANIHKIGKFKCEEEGCDGVFAYKSGLEEHVKFRHKGEVIPKKHVCEVCGLRSRTPASLKEHVTAMHINNESKPFKCVQCDQRFPTENRLKSHYARLHIGKGKALE